MPSLGRQGVSITNWVGGACPPGWLVGGAKEPMALIATPRGLGPLVKNEVGQASSELWN